MADPAPAPTPWVMSPLEAAKVLGISRSAIYDAIAREEVPAFRVGGQWRIPATLLAERCGIREAETVTAVRDELRRARIAIQGVVAMGNLDRLSIEQLLDARDRIDAALQGLTAQQGD